jgi:hypothetical protein
MVMTLPDWLTESFTYGGPGAVVVAIAVFLVRHYRLSEMGPERATGHTLVGFGVTAMGIVCSGLVCATLNLNFAKLSSLMGLGGTLFGAVNITAGFVVLSLYPRKPTDPPTSA